MSKLPYFDKIVIAIIALAVIGAIALGTLGILYLLAAAVVPSRLWIGITLLGVSLILAFLVYKSLAKPTPINVQWSPSGPIKPEELKCPNCGGTLKIDDPNKTRVVCQYCDRVVEIVEEPKW
jgi:hypothetical protein